MGLTTMSLPRRSLLSEEETQELLFAVRNGNPAAREKLVRENLRLVYSVCQRFLYRGKELEDLFQVGSIGLLKAIDKFDPCFGVCFSTYAVPMIMGEIKRHFRDDNPIRVSRSLKDTARKVMYEKQRLTALMQREPTIDEISKSLELARDEVILALDAVTEPLSLQEAIFTAEDGYSLEDRLKSGEAEEEECLDHLLLEELIDTLNEGEKTGPQIALFC